MIEFEATPNSFRQLKISDIKSDGGGSRMTLDFTDTEYENAFKLSLFAGKRMKFRVEPVLE